MDYCKMSLELTELFGCGCVAVHWCLFSEHVHRSKVSQNETVVTVDYEPLMTRACV